MKLHEFTISAYFIDDFPFIKEDGEYICPLKECDDSVKFKTSKSLGNHLLVHHDHVEVYLRDAGYELNDIIRPKKKTDATTDKKT